MIYNRKRSNIYLGRNKAAIVMMNRKRLRTITIMKNKYR